MHACTLFMYEIHALKNVGPLFKRLRYCINRFVALAMVLYHNKELGKKMSEQSSLNTNRTKLESDHQIYNFSPNIYFIEFFIEINYLKSRMRKSNKELNLSSFLYIQNFH